MVFVVGENVFLLHSLHPAQLKDPELVRLAHMLPGVLVQDRADKMVTTYVNAFCRCREWATQHGVVALPADPVQCA